MSTSLRDLFARAQQDARASSSTNAPATAQEAEAAIAALAHVSRALRRLSSDGVHGQLGHPERQQRVELLAQRTAHAAAAWVPIHGRLPDLIGVAADVTGRLDPQLTPASRWAIAVAFAEAARHCTATAQGFRPYRDLAPLMHVHPAAAAVEQHAAADPPTTVGTVVLDHLVPHTRAPSGANGIERAAESAISLLAAVRSRVARNRLTLAEALAASAVARSASTDCTAFAAALTRRDSVSARPWDAVPAAWRAVQLSYAPLDDGSKLAAPTDSPVLAWAVALHEGLRTARAHPSHHDQIATGLRAIANQLPELAQLLKRASDGWGLRRQLFAPERRLISYERRNLAVTSTDQILPVDSHDLSEVRSALRDAQQLSASLCSELHRTYSIIGSQPQPYLAAAHATIVTGEAATRELARRAAVARRRGAAPAPAQFTVPRPPGAAPAR